MTDRDELIAFIIWAISEIEGVEVEAEAYSNKTTEWITQEADWYDYLLGK